MYKKNAKIIAKQNDEFRKNFGTMSMKKKEVSGLYLMSEGVSSLKFNQQLDIMLKVINYKNFHSVNDPQGKRDHGSFFNETLCDIVIWNISYYDLAYQGYSEDESDLTKTNRVLTVSFSHEN